MSIDSKVNEYILKKALVELTIERLSSYITDNAADTARGLLDVINELGQEVKSYPDTPKALDALLNRLTSSFENTLEDDFPMEMLPQIYKSNYETFKQLLKDKMSKFSYTATLVTKDGVIEHVYEVITAGIPDDKKEAVRNVIVATVNALSTPPKDMDIDKISSLVQAKLRFI